jgi:protein TonB
MRIETGNVNANSLAFAMPNVDLNASLGGGTFTGQMGGPGAGGMFDGDIIPLQRIPPQYPRDAARSGITGWVQLEVLVNADGTVRSARVLEAKPKGLFEAAAVQAVLRWKFKPKVVNGQPVQQKGAQRIEFNLNAPA